MSPRLILPALAATVLLTASACGSSDSGQQGSAQQNGEQSGQNGQNGQNAAGARRFPGANGEIVDVSGSTLQVQGTGAGGQSGQTAVTYSAKTAITRQVAGTLKDVTVGSCVMVTDASAASGSASSRPTALPSTVAAKTVRVTPAGSDGTCSPGGPGGAGGAGGPGRGGAAPSGAPSGMPSGMPSGGPGSSGRGGFGGSGGFGTVGKVASVNGSGFTVTRTAFGSQKATTVTVTASSSTSYTTQKAATAADVKVGVCASARGTTDTTGAVAATSISLSAKTDGVCMGGFGPGGPGGGRPGDGGTA